MNSYYFTFGHGHPHHPGFVMVIAPDPYKARSLMVGEYGVKWAGQYEALEDIHPNDRIAIDEIIYSQDADDALRWTCDICKAVRMNTKIGIEPLTVTFGGHDKLFNVHYCVDNLDCKESVKAQMNRLTEDVLGAFREIR